MINIVYKPVKVTKGATYLHGYIGDRPGGHLAIHPELGRDWWAF